MKQTLLILFSLVAAIAVHAAAPSVNTFPLTVDANGNLLPDDAPNFVKIGKTLFVDSVNGHDSGASAGVRGRWDKPYLTLTVAKTAASSGDLIVVRPGTYNENDLAKNGVNWHFEPGAAITYTGTSIRGIFDDYGGAITTKITGEGVFTFSSTGTFSSTSIGAINVTNASSDFNISGRVITTTVAGGSPGTGGLAQTAGILRVRAFRISNTATGGVSAAAIWWNGGEMHVEAFNVTGSDYALYSVAPAQSSNAEALWLRANFVSGKRIEVSGNVAAQVWIDALEIDLTAATSGTPMLLTSGKIYLDAQKIFLGSATSIPDVIAGGIYMNAQVWLRAEKITQSGTAYALNVAGGMLVANVNQFERTGSGTLAMIYSGGGAADITSQKLVVPNAGGKAVEIGGGTVSLNGARIDSSASTTSDAVSVSGGTANFVGCQITSGSGRYDIVRTAGTANVINGRGTNSNGTFTTSGTVNYVSNNFSKADIVPVANGGTGTATPAIVAGTNVSVSGTWPNQTINATGGGSGDFSSNTSSSVDGEVVLFSGTGGKTGKRATTTGLAKLTSGVLSAAASGTDYAPATSGSAILKGNGSGGFSSATSGTDYAGPPSRQTFSNAAVTVTAGTTTLAQTGTMSAARVVTFPAASSYANGTGFTVVDESGTLTSANKLVATRAGSDTINGATSIDLITAYASPFFRSDGTSKWTMDVQGIARGGTGATTAAGARTNFGVGTGDSPTFAGLSISGNTYLNGANTSNDGALVVTGSSSSNTSTGAIFRFDSNSGSNDSGFKIGALAGAGSAGYSWVQGVATGVGFNRLMVLQPTNGGVAIGSTTDPGAGSLTVGGGAVHVKQRTAPTANTDSAVLYAEDVAGTAEMKVKDEAGNATQISPHAVDSPGASIDEGTSDAMPVVIHHSNDYLGTEEWIHLSALAKEVENLTGKKFIYSRQTSSKLSWDTVQAKHKAERDAQVAAWQQRKKAADKALADFMKLPVEQKAAQGMPEPFRESKPEPFSKKPLPAFLARRGAK